MTLFLLALLQTAPALGAIGPQALPARGCAAFLWQTGTPAPQLVAMSSAEPGTLVLSVDGAAVTLPRSAVRGDTQLGLPAGSDYAGEALTATLDLSVAESRDLSDGARVPAGTLSVTRAGGDAVVVPVAGLIGCATATR